MPTFRFPVVLLFLALLGLTLGNCKNNNEPEPEKPTIQASQLTSGSWRLDQIKQNGQVTSSGASIKDQYSLTFRTDGTYTQKILADNTVYNGTWMLMSNNTILHLTDHKGDDIHYTLASLTATELRYSFTNKNNQIEELVFSAQP